MAVLEALRSALPPVIFDIDNATVVRGFRRGRAWRECAKRPHADLWRAIWAIVEDLGGVGEGAVSVVKVKAHRTQAEARTLGGDDKRHYVGNHLADEAAKAGTRLAEPPPGLVDKWRARWADTQGVLDYVCAFVGAVDAFRDTQDVPPRRRAWELMVPGSGRCRQRDEVPEGGHVFQRQWTGDTWAWRCSRCARLVHTAGQFRRARREACKRAPPIVPRSGGRTPTPARPAGEETLFVWEPWAPYPP